MSRKGKVVSIPRCEPRCPRLYLVSTRFEGKPGNSIIYFHYRCEVCRNDHIGSMGEKMVAKILTKHTDMKDG